MTDRAAAPAPVPPLPGADTADQLAHLRLALEAADTGLWTWDPHTDAVAWSAETYRIHRLQPHEFDNTGASFFALVFREDRARVSATVRAAIAARTLYECEFRIVRPGGELLWVANRGRAVYDADGKPLRMLGTITDISQRKRAEDALRTRERELQTLADNSPDILTRFDRALRHVFVNVAVEKATGRPRAEFLGRSNRELGMPPDQCAVWDAHLQRAFDTGEPGELDFAFEGPLGLRHYSARFVPEFGAGGEVEHVLGVTRDVTNHRLAEEALKEADRQKDEFLATLAHELRNPLAPIRNGLEILRQDPALQGTAARAAHMMARQLAHLVRLVDDLLDVSRISRGKVELRRERVALQSVIEHALEASRPLIESNGHALALRVAAEPIRVDGDLTRLAQVVSNLLNNAAKYTPAGGCIELWAGVEAGQAVVRVSDDGIGIAPDMLPRVFDLFAQAEGARHRAQGGLGIGLSLVRRLAEMHGGSIEAQSAGAGRGSVFTLRLPLSQADAEAPAPVPLAEVDMPGRAARRVLVVDDNVDAADSLAMMLQLIGHEARAVHDGAAALEQAPAWQPDIVLLDIGLPGMDGYEVARRLRADAALAGTLLVALTGWGSEADKRRSAEAGFDAHLTKPVALGDVEAVLARVPSTGPDVVAAK
ncbi:hybrid sensor histidine kinase/response regulator [Azohydromonas aeria]|uniref:hybrid sensor histidine kinase/response regulator n=1 Tax=Azohydromonas aeria TaxID=2590212 RepID=UPI0018DEFBF5|nr:ATP-binding protein [Azohydromonas aeria]